MNKDALCRAFCADVDVNAVPIGFVVRTPFTRPDGDFVSFYIREDRATGQCRLEDDGSTIAFLEANGLDLDLDSRRELLADLLREYDCVYDEDEVLIHTRPMSERDIPRASLQFSALILRLQDLLFATPRRVFRHFRDDLGDLIEAHFSSGFTVERNGQLSEDAADYVADFVIRRAGGSALAVFAGSSEMRALEALLFWRETRERALTNVRSMIVLERPKPQNIKDRTLSRVLNSGLILATYEHEQASLVQKIRDTIGMVH